MSSGPWDDYKGAQTAPSSQSVPGPWDDYAAADAPQAKAGVGNNFMAGVNTAIADTLGAPVDLVNWGAHHNLVSMGLNAASRALGYGDIDKSEVASEAHQPKAPFGGSESIKSGMGLINANPDDVAANSAGERFARAAGTGAAMVAAPEFAARDAPTLLTSAYRGLKGVGIGAASGLGSEAGQELAPEPLKPLASLIGGLIGGGVPAAAGPLLKAGGRSVGMMSAADAERAAATKVANSASDLDSARGSLADVPELVPGSKPTTYQATGDAGLGGLTRDMEKKYPARFAQRATDQNAARVDQLTGLQPSGDPADVGDFLRHTLRTLDDTGTAQIDAATAHARQRAEQLGGTGAPEEYGSALRQHAQDAANAARARERGLWQAIDPDGNLTINAAPLRSAAEDVFGGVGRSARPLSNDERAIKDVVQSYGHTVPFRDIGDLRSWVSEAMRQELRTGGNTQSYGRLARLRGSIEDAITATAEAKAQSAPEEVHSRLQQYGRTLEQDALHWRAARASGVQSISAAQSYGTSGVSPRFGASVEGQGGFPDATGDQGIPSAPFDAAARERLTEATQATRNRVDTFGTGPVGQILRKAGRQDQYRIPDSSVAAKIFHPGASGFEHVQQYRQAVGDPAALLGLHDYAASSLRSAALRTDGTLDPGRVNSWLRSHADALRAFPDLQSRFADAGRASEAVTNAMTARRAAMDAYETGALAKVMRVSGSDDVSRAIGGILGSRNRVEQMRDLARATSGDENARAGLRKSVADFIQRRFVSPSAEGSVGDIKANQFAQFVHENNAALRTVFNEREVGALRAISADLWRTSARPPLTTTSGPSLLKRMLGEGAGTAIGAMSSLHSPFAGWLGAKALGAIRDAGFKRVDDIVRDAMLNPELAYALLRKGKPDSALAADMTRALRTASVANLGLSTLAKKDRKSSSEPPRLPAIPDLPQSVAAAPSAGLIPGQDTKLPAGLLPPQPRQRDSLLGL